MGTIAEFYDLETEKLAADGRRVALFTDHPGTVGAYREARLQQYVYDHVARRFSISSGFISYRDDTSDNISDRSSKQIDCLIYDQTDQACLLYTETFACVEPDQVAAFVEVKSVLGLSREYAPGKGGSSEDHPFIHEGRGYRWSGTFIEALSNVVSASNVMAAAGKERHTYFSGIFSYSGTELKLLDANSLKEIVQQLSIVDLDQMPDCVCVLTSGWWSFEAYDWEPKLDITSYSNLPDYDANSSVFIKVSGKKLNGIPLQLFTAYLSGRLDDRALGSRPRIGGLRSARGRDFEVDNLRFLLPSPGRG